MHPSGESDVAVVIPARFGSTRFPGKPLAQIRGKPMIVRVAEAARRAQRVRAVYVATDDDRIAEAARAAGFSAILTPSACATGTDRVSAAVRQLAEEPELVVNVQGDEPLLDPRDLDALIAASLADREAIGTLARPLLELRRFADPNLVKVVTDVRGRALYFSRSAIPHGGDTPLAHVGIYAYPPALLARFVALPVSRLERSERLEQLRALENGLPIRVTLCVSERPSLAVDVPEDVARVEAELEISDGHHAT